MYYSIECVAVRLYMFIECVVVWFGWHCNYSIECVAVRSMRFGWHAEGVLWLSIPFLGPFSSRLCLQSRCVCPFCCLSSAVTLLVPLLLPHVVVVFGESGVELKLKQCWALAGRATPHAAPPLQTHAQVQT